MIDLMAGTGALDLAAVTRLQQLKTGALIGWCLEAAAIMGRVPPEGRTGLRGYARDTGLAFQIADDLLDHEGCEEKAGKRVGKPYPDAFLPMLKAGCLKSKDSDAVVDKRRQCVEKAKTEAEMNACNG